MCPSLLFISINTDMREYEFTSPSFVIVMGGAGSGKNYFIEHDHTLSTYSMVDVDSMKLKMPLSQAISAIKPELERYFQAKTNVVHPTTGANIKGQLNKIALAKQYGYRIILILCDTDPEVAVQRVAKRVAAGQHDVEHDVIIASNQKARANFEQLKAHVDQSRVITS